MAPGRRHGFAQIAAALAEVDPEAFDDDLDRLRALVVRFAEANAGMRPAHGDDRADPRSFVGFLVGDTDGEFHAPGTSSCRRLDLAASMSPDAGVGVT